MIKENQVSKLLPKSRRSRQNLAFYLAMSAAPVVGWGAHYRHTTWGFYIVLLGAVLLGVANVIHVRNR
jgi:hypothetical protein